MKGPLVALRTSFPVVAVRTDLWVEASEISKPGLLGSIIKGWKCNHCGLESWNRNAARLQYHLSGDSQLRGGGFNGVDVCTKVSE